MTHTLPPSGRSDAPGPLALADAPGPLALASLTDVAPTTAAIPEQRETGFKAVSGGPEMASGATLLVEAYAALWLLLFAFVWASWRRLGQAESKITALERVLGSEPSPGAARTSRNVP